MGERHHHLLIQGSASQAWRSRRRIADWRPQPVPLRRAPSLWQSLRGSRLVRLSARAGTTTVDLHQQDRVVTVVDGRVSDHRRSDRLRVFSCVLLSVEEVGLWQDAVIAATVPYHMSVSARAGYTPRERCPPVGCPGHLVEAWYATYPLDSQARSEPVLFAGFHRLQIGDKLSRRSIEPVLVGSCQSSVAAQEPRRFFMCRHS